MRAAEGDTARVPLFFPLFLLRSDEATGATRLHALAHALVSRFLSVCAPCTVAASSCCCTLVHTLTGSENSEGETLSRGDVGLPSSTSASLSQGTKSCPHCSLLLGLRWREDCCGFEYFVACRRSSDACRGGPESGEVIRGDLPSASCPVESSSKGKYDRSQDQDKQLPAGTAESVVPGSSLDNSHTVGKELKGSDQTVDSRQQLDEAAAVPSSAAGSSGVFFRTGRAGGPDLEGDQEDMNLLLLIQHDVVQPCVFDGLAVQLTFRAALVRLLPFVTVREEALGFLFSPSADVSRLILSGDGCESWGLSTREDSDAVLERQWEGERDAAGLSRGTVEGGLRSSGECHRSKREVGTPEGGPAGEGGRFWSGGAGDEKGMTTGMLRENEILPHNHSSGRRFETPAQEDSLAQVYLRQLSCSGPCADGVEGERRGRDSSGRKEENEVRSSLDGTSCSYRSSSGFSSLLTLLSSPVALVDALERSVDPAPLFRSRRVNGEETGSPKFRRGQQRGSAMRLEPPLSFIKKKKQPMSLNLLIRNLLFFTPAAEVPRVHSGEGAPKPHRKRGAVEVEEALDSSPEAKVRTKLEKKLSLFESLLNWVGGLNVTCEYLTVTTQTLFGRSRKADIVLALLFPTQQEIVLEKYLAQKRSGQRPACFLSSKVGHLEKREQKAAVVREALKRFLRRTWPTVWSPGRAGKVLRKCPNSLLEDICRGGESSGQEGSEFLSDGSEFLSDGEARSQDLGTRISSTLRFSADQAEKVFSCEKASGHYSDLDLLSWQRQLGGFCSSVGPSKSSGAGEHSERARPQTKSWIIDMEAHPAKGEGSNAEQVAILGSATREPRDYGDRIRMEGGADDLLLSEGSAAGSPLSPRKCWSSSVATADGSAAVSSSVGSQQSESGPGNKQVSGTRDSKRGGKRTGEGPSRHTSSRSACSSAVYPVSPLAAREMRVVGYEDGLTFSGGNLTGSLASALVWRDQQGPEVGELLLPTSLQKPWWNHVLGEQDRLHQARVSAPLTVGGGTMWSTGVDGRASCPASVRGVGEDSPTKRRGAAASALQRSQVGNHDADECLVHCAARELTPSSLSPSRLLSNGGNRAAVKIEEAPDQGCAEVGTESRSLEERGWCPRPGAGQSLLHSEGDSSGTESTSRATWVNAAGSPRPGSVAGSRGIGDDKCGGPLRWHRLETKGADADRARPSRKLWASTVDVSTLRDGRDFRVDWRSDCDYGSGGSSDEEEEPEGGGRGGSGPGRYRGGEIANVRGKNSRREYLRRRRQSFMRGRGKNRYDWGT